MKEDTKIILLSHNHLPHGSTHDELETLYSYRLKPFITTLYKYPQIPATLHYSGSLLYWIERNHPEFLMILDDLITRKQVELLGGGFYEPMMPLLSLSDRIGQIEMLTTYLRKHFNRRPQGCWLPALAWDANIIGSLYTSGMLYTFLEEDQFLSAGVKADSLEYPRISEEQGKTITVFPLASRYSEAIAHEETDGVLERIAADDGSGERIISILSRVFYSGEIANSAEHTSELAIHQFFESLSKWQDRVLFTLPSKVLKTIPCFEKVFFPASAERGFMQWAVDSDDVAQYQPQPSVQASHHGPVQGQAVTPNAVPRRYLIKYPEANGIYSKMIYAGLLINQLRGDKSRKRTAREELWKAQGCDVFCHAGDGGLYHNGLRKAAYSSLLEAECITREKGKFIPSLVAFDFDMDGEKEYLFQTRDINAYVKAQGASVFELDYLPKTWNYLDTMARRREPYAGELLALDNYRRSAFVDRLVSTVPSLEDGALGRFPASRFCGIERFDLVSMDRTRQEAVFRLRQRLGAPFGNIEIEKTYSLKKDTLKAAYLLANKGETDANFSLLTEIDLSFAGAGQEQQRVYTIGKNGKEPLALIESDVKGTGEIEFQDLKNEAVIYLRSDDTFDCWLLPIRTRCRVNGEVRDRYQSTCVVPIKAVSLKAGDSVKTQYTLRFQH